MSQYDDDSLDNAETRQGGSFFRPGNHLVEVSEVQDGQSKNPKRRGALCYRVQCEVIESQPAPGEAGHYAGEKCAVVIFHGLGTPGYDPAKGTSYGDNDIKAFLEQLVISVDRKPFTKGWGTLNRNVVGPGQAARGIRLRVRCWMEPDKKGTKDAATGQVIMYPRTRFEPVPGQASLAGELLAGVSIDGAAPLPASTRAPAAATPPASAPAAPGAPTPPRPPAPPAAEHPMADEVRKQAAGWAASGQTAEAAINGLLGWAVGLGLTDAQARAAIKSQF
jgi:hypothetical protein